MDRRAALQKLAAGGLIAAGTPLVLDARRVAAAASGPLAPPAEELTVTTSVTGGSAGVLTIDDSPFPPDAQFAWTLPAGWSLQAGNGATVTVLPPPGNYEQGATFTFTASTFAGSSYDVVVFVDMKGNGTNLKTFQFLSLTGPHQA